MSRQIMLLAVLRIMCSAQDFWFTAPIWKSIGPTKIPNAHACDNVAEAALFAAGRIQAFAIDLANPNVMYAGGGVGTGNSGPSSDAGFYKTIDGGIHWTSSVAGLADRFVDALWLDQSNRSTLLASTWHGGIYRSTDSGQSWVNVYSSPTTSIIESGSTVLAAAAAGIVLSSDRGASWILIKSTSSPARALACGAGACYAGLEDGTVLVQATPSSAWMTTLSGGTGTVWDVAVNPANPAEAIVSRSQSFGAGMENLITHNAGASWTAFNVPPRNPCGGGGPAKVIAYDAVDPNTLYAGAGGLMWVSHDSATSWTELHLYEDLNLIYPFPGQGGKLVVGGDQGIYMSQDSGTTWTTLNGDLGTSLLTHIAVSGSEIMTAVQDFSPILTFDGGATWLQGGGYSAPCGEDGVVVINPGNTLYQYVWNGACGFGYSSDGGRSFTNDNANLPLSEWTFNGTTDYIAIDPANAQHLYLVGASGILQSTDYGIHWSPTGWPISNPTFVVIDPNDSKTIFVGSIPVPPPAPGAVLFTHDGGATWNTAQLPANSQWPLSLAVDPADSSTVVLASSTPPDQPGGGVMVSTDGGRTFSADSQGLVGKAEFLHYAWSVKFAPPSIPHVVVLATSYGLYISKAGSPWTNITGNAVPQWFNAVAWSGGNLYAATFGQGVLQAPISAIVLPCTFTAAPAQLYFDSAASSKNVALTASGTSCAWNTSSASGWITPSPPMGAGSAMVNIAVGSNSTGLDRIGSAIAGGQTVNVTQRFTAITFTDVAPPDFFFDGANLLYAKGITAGCSTSPLKYCPNDNVTRGQMAIFITRAVLGGDPVSYTQTPYFTDVPSSHPFFKWIQALRDLNITAGCGPQLYCPDSSVTRDQMAVFIIRARYGASATFSYPSTPDFTDVPSSNTFFSWIQKMAQVGITAGCGTQLYCPTNPVTRGQMAIFIMRGAFNQLLPVGTPVISMMSPGTVTHGLTANITLTGVNTNFVQGTTQVSAGSGITVNSVTVTNGQSLTANVTVAAGATLGPRSLVATTGAEEAVLPNGLTVQ